MIGDGLEPSILLHQGMVTPSLDQFDMNNNWYATNIISDGRGVFGYTGQTGYHGDSRY